MAMVNELLRSDIVDDPSRDGAREPDRAVEAAQRRRRWSRDASLAAIALGAIGGFLALTRVVVRRSDNPFDLGLVRAVGRARSPILSAIAQGLTFFGSVPGAGGLSAVAVILARHKPRLASQIAIGALGGITAELGIKRFFKRRRPTLLEHLEEVESSSFPSGHSTASASIYLTMAFVASRSPRLRAHRGELLAGAGVLAASVGASRVYLGVHWPTDVLSGLAIGTAWACVAEALYDVTGAEQVARQARAPAALLPPLTPQT